MGQRSQQIDTFLQRNGWGDAERRPLAGDASFRRYERVVEAARRAVLMDAPPDRESVQPFIQVDQYLVEWGYSAPRILARDVEAGLLLLEDLGDDSFTRLLKNAPLKEHTLYMKAGDLLVDLHQRDTARCDLPEYDEARLLDELALFADWYLPAVLGAEAEKHRARLIDIWRGLLASMPFLPPVLVLRDYHADNLMWLPQREDVAQVGLLDFQDAVTGSPAYDLVSCLEDARRDLQPETVQVVLNHYLQQMAWDRSDFMAVYALLGAQRNTKIIGIFTRLAQRDGKMQYLDYLPRVWQHLHHDLQHPILNPYREWLDRVLPQELRHIPTIEKRKAG